MVHATFVPIQAQLCQLDVAPDKSNLGPCAGEGGAWLTIGVWLKVLDQEKKLPMVPFHLHHKRALSLTRLTVVSFFINSFPIHSDSVVESQFSQALLVR